MFERIGNGFNILGKAIIFFFKNPKTIFPIVLAWLFITPIILYIQYNFSFSNLSIGEVFIVVFIIIFGVTLVTSLASLILLELLEQHETEGQMSLGKAFKDAFVIDMLRALPLIIAWSIIQFLLLIVEAMIEAGKSKNRKSRSRSKSFSFESTVRDSDGGSVFFDFIKKGLRMGVMLMFAGIAWEELSSKDAYRKGIRLYKTNMATMLTGVSIGMLIQFLIMIPVGIMVYLADEGMQFSETAWMIAFFYGGFAWSLNIFVEQMFAAEIYLWNRTYEIELEKAKAKGEKLPTLKSTKMPSFIDDIQSLKVYKNVPNEVDDPFEKYDKVAY